LTLWLYHQRKPKNDQKFGARSNLKKFKQPLPVTRVALAWKEAGAGFRIHSCTFVQRWFYANKTTTKKPGFVQSYVNATEIAKIYFTDRRNVK